MTENDEFKDVRKGVPPENTLQNSKKKTAMLFTAAGLVFGTLVLVLLQPTLRIRAAIHYATGPILNQIIAISVMAVMIASIQSWILRSRIQTKAGTFILHALLGGILGGFAAGLLILSGVGYSLLLGLIAGLVAGSVSSALQSKLLTTRHVSSRWRRFSILSWGIIFAIGWALSWGVPGDSSMALAALVIMVLSGVSLVFFMNKNQDIEFS